MHTVNSISVLTFFYFHLFLSRGSSPAKLNSECGISDWRNSTGNCKLLQECGPAISALRAGIKPTLCQNQNTYICCPSKPRISEEMCEGYLEILREHYGPTPLLPLDFLQNRPKEIQCVNFVNQLIVDGRDAKQDEFPHMVALGWGTNPAKLQFGCGGTLISENFILTAAHCVDTKNGRPSYALLGDIHLKPEYEEGSPQRIIVKIVQFIKHPRYRKPLTYNDIALLRLEKKVVLSRSILPACLPQPSFRPEQKTNTIASGWGQTGTAESPSNIVQAVNLTRFGIKECNDYYSIEQPERFLKYPNGITRTQFCAGDRDKVSNKDTCRGDSGGPLVITSEKHKCVFHVVGVTSFGSSVCGIQPGVYTNVQSYLDFIERNVWPEQRV